MTASRGRAWRLAIHDSLASTSDLCRARALAGEGEGLAVLARRQTAGRGTQGRAWASPAGNLYLSVLLRPAEPARLLGLYALLGAVAVVRALAALLPAPDALSLKWPNDVLLHGRKLAGLLAEGAASADGTIDFLVLGIGVNLAVAPDLPDRPTACLAECAPPPAPEAAARAILETLTAWRARWEADGFAPVRQEWLRWGPAPGTKLRLRVGGAVRSGRFAGIDDQGGLLLATPEGVAAFAAGEVLTEAQGGA